MYCPVQKVHGMQLIGKDVYGPWALVTGGSSGIGEEVARQAAANGINVLLARREERLKEVAVGLTARYAVQTRVAAVDLGRDGILTPGRRERDRSCASAREHAGRRPHRYRPDRAAGRAYLDRAGCR